MHADTKALTTTTTTYYHHHPSTSSTTSSPAATTTTTSPLKESETDTLHLRLDLLLNPDDEAAKILMDYTAANPHLTRWTAAEEDALVRQIDWRIMPVLCVTYALQWYDKAMLSQAALFGLIEDLGLGDGGRYSLSAAIFYLGFMAGEFFFFLFFLLFLGFPEGREGGEGRGGDGLVGGWVSEWGREDWI